MRFSEAFDSIFMPLVQGDDGASPATGPDDDPKSPAQDVQEDLAQRVRQIGEWQLEDW